MRVSRSRLWLLAYFPQFWSACRAARALNLGEGRRDSLRECIRERYRVHDDLNASDSLGPQANADPIVVLSGMSLRFASYAGMGLVGNRAIGAAKEDSTSFWIWVRRCGG